MEIYTCYNLNKRYQQFIVNLNYQHDGRNTSWSPRIVCSPRLRETYEADVAPGVSVRVVEGGDGGDLARLRRRVAPQDVAAHQPEGGQWGYSVAVTGVAQGRVH